MGLGVQDWVSREQCIERSFNKGNGRANRTQTFEVCTMSSETYMKRIRLSIFLFMTIYCISFSEIRITKLKLKLLAIVLFSISKDAVISNVLLLSSASHFHNNIWKFLYSSQNTESPSSHSDSMDGLIIYLTRKWKANK